jgi:membrane protein DedA with SNARE-associated domain
MTSFLVSHAIYAIILFGVLEAMCIPISSELTFLLGGAIASGAVSGTHQHPSLLLVIVVGTLAELVGSYISYGIGRAGGRPLVRRWGRYVLVTEADVARAERFLVGRGVWAIPVARMLPFVRAFASIVAGIVEVPALRFGVLSLIGTFIYVVVLSSIGYSLGSEWSKINHGITQATYVLAAIVVVAIVGFVVYRLREFRKEEAAAARQQAPAGPAGQQAPSGRPGQHRRGAHR